MEEDDQTKRVLKAFPLTRFSIYADGICSTIRALGNDILSGLEESITRDDNADTTQVAVPGYDRAQRNFWLWVLGAYEIVRTMNQASECFVPKLNAELAALKEPLSTIRMPFAKLELRGSRNPRPVHGELSPVTIGHSPPDIVYQVGNERITARTLIKEFERVFGSITSDDVLGDHRTTY